MYEKHENNFDPHPHPNPTPPLLAATPPPSLREAILFKKIYPHYPYQNGVRAGGVSAENDSMGDFT